MLKPKMYHIRGEHSDHYNADAVLEKNTIQPKRRLKPGPLDIILNGNHLRTISSRFVVMATVLWFIVVATLWGGTNPLIKKESHGVESIKRNNKIQQVLAELFFLFSNWKYCVAFLLNQSGSVLFYLTLASVDLSLAVPVTNSLTFIFTMLSGHIFGEKIKSLETYIGIVLVVAGVALCVSDKV